jgi:hypothetical protein
MIQLGNQCARVTVLLTAVIAKLVRTVTKPLLTKLVIKCWAGILVYMRRGLQGKKNWLRKI